MFSKPKTENTASTPSTPANATMSTAKPEQKPAAAPAPAPAPSAGTPAPAPSKAKPQPSLLSEDIVVQGNVISEGDIQIEGTVEGDVRCHLLTVGETAVIRGEIAGDDVVVHGHVVGRLRGLKVRLTSSARVEGDIVHKTIAIESGAEFEGSVQRNDNPLGDSSSKISSIKDAKTTAAE